MKQMSNQKWKSLLFVCSGYFPELSPSSITYSLKKIDSSKNQLPSASKWTPKSCHSSKYIKEGLQVHQVLSGKSFFTQRLIFISLIYHCFRRCISTKMVSGKYLRAEIVHKKSSALISDPIFNKGLAFPKSERDRLGLRGIIPPAT